MLPNFSRYCFGVGCALFYFLFLTIRTPADAILKEVLSVSGTDFPGRFRGAMVNAFDISPGGTTLAAAFLSGEGQKPDGTRMAAVQIAQWDIAGKKVTKVQQVDEAAPLNEIVPNPQYRFDLKFTPDGRKLVAQLGRHIKVLDAAALTVLYPIEPPKVLPNPSTGTTIRGFAISDNSKWLAVLSSDASSPCEPTSAQLVDLDTGQQVAEWVLSKNACPYSISLSPDGGQMLLSDYIRYPGATADLDLVDSHTGKLVRDFDVGFGTAGSPFGVGSAQFLGQDRFLAEVVVNMTAPAEVPKSKLVVCDVQTGKLLHQLTYSVYGVRGVVAVANKAPIVAVLGSGPVNPELPLRSNSNLGFERILLFRADGAEPFYVSADRGSTEPVTYRNVDPSAPPLHISSDGRIIAVSEGDSIKVYELRTEI